VDGEEGSIGTLAQPLKLQPLGIEGIEMVGGKVNIDKDGNLGLTEGDISVEKGNVEIKTGKIKGNDDIRGRVTLKAGERTIRIDKNWEEEPVIINITLDYDTTHWVNNLSKDGFKLEVKVPPTEDKEVQWMAVW
jgi:hypothetical protein